MVWLLSDWIIVKALYNRVDVFGEWLGRTNVYLAKQESSRGAAILRKQWSGAGYQLGNQLLGSSAAGLISNVKLKKS